MKVIRNKNDVPRSLFLKILVTLYCFITFHLHAEIVDDFSSGGWTKWSQTPSTITTSKNQLIIDDNTGDAAWASAEKTYSNINLSETPYLILYVTTVENELEIKIAGIDFQKSIYQSDFKNGQIVLNMDSLTTPYWGEPKTGNLSIRIYAIGDGSKIELNKLVITGAVADKFPANGGLDALAARSNARRPSAFSYSDGERVIYKDPVTGNEVWKMTKDSDRQRHTYGNIRGWNSNGSKLIFLTRQDSFAAGCGIMDAAGSNIELLPPELGIGGSSLYSNGYWSYSDPDKIYYRTYDSSTQTTTLLYYDISTNTSTAIDSFAIQGTPPTDSNFLVPPHTSDEAFCLVWGQQGVDDALIAVYDTDSETLYELTPEVTQHHVRFTNNSDKSIHLVSTTEIVQDRKLLLDGSSSTLPVIGTHPDWTSDGSWAIGWIIGGKLNRINYAGTISEVVAYTNSASEHGSISLADDEYVVGDASGGYYGNMIYGVNVETGIIEPICCHGSSYGSDESTHPGPKDSPDGTKVMYNSDMGAEYSDVYVAIRKRPQGPYNVQFSSGTLSWDAPYLNNELKGYNIYRRTNDEWVRTQSLVTGTSVTGLSSGVYGVTTQEYSNLESNFEGYNAVDDVFVDGGWAASTSGGPGNIILSSNNLTIEDYSGDSSFTSALKTFPNIDLNTTPYLVIQATEISGGTLQIKVGGGGRTWTSVHNASSTGLIVIDIPTATSWTQMTGDLRVGVYTVTDGSSIKLSSIKITDTKPMVYTAIKDVFVDGGWEPSYGPGNITVNRNNLTLEDLFGDSNFFRVTKTFPNIDLTVTPYLVLQVAEVIDGTLQVKLGGGGRTWTSVHNASSTGLIVIDIPTATSWTQMTGDLIVGLYTVSDGSSVKIKNLKITDTKPTTASIPTGLTVDTTASTYTSLSWNASTDGMFDHYNVYAASDSSINPSNATLVGSPNVASFVDYGLSSSSTYYYRITAVDSQGNESVPTSATSATTAAESFGLIDDFSDGGWAKYVETPYNITIEKDKLKIEDLTGDIAWAAVNKNYFINIYDTPYLIFYVTSITGGNLSVKINGHSGENWDRKTVYTGNSTGTVVIDIPTATGWTEEDGDIFVQIYTVGDGSSVELSKLEFSDESP
jgi:Fibronectin type III domain